MHAQLYLTLCHPMDCDPPGSSVHGISRQEHWIRLSFPPPGDLLDSGTQPMSLVSPAFAGRFFTQRSTYTWAPPASVQEYFWEQHQQNFNHFPLKASYVALGTFGCYFAIHFFTSVLLLSWGKLFLLLWRELKLFSI